MAYRLGANLCMWEDCANINGASVGRIQVNLDPYRWPFPNPPTFLRNLELDLILCERHSKLWPHELPKGLSLGWGKD